MDVETLLRRVDFSTDTADHKNALRQKLFGQSQKSGQGYELSLDDLEYVTAASKIWIEQEKHFPH